MVLKVFIHSLGNGVNKTMDLDVNALSTSPPKKQGNSLTYLVRKRRLIKPIVKPSALNEEVTFIKTII